MPSDIKSGPQPSPQDVALATLADVAASNVPGADFVSITERHGNGELRTVASTHPVAEQADALQYELREGPCYAAVTDERFVLVNNLETATEFPRYGPQALALGLGAQAAIQLVHNGSVAGLNLYARSPGSFNSSTAHFGELFANQAGVLLGYATQVDNLSEALRTRTEIGTAVGIVMERYDIEQHQAFAFLTRTSQNRNLKVRTLAQQIIDGSFVSDAKEDWGRVNLP